MKTTLSICYFCAAFFCLYRITTTVSFAQTPTSGSAEDIAAITTTLHYYIEGGTNRDTVMFAKAFLMQGQLIGVTKDSVIITSLKDFVARQKSGEKLNRTCRISNIQVYGTAASARLELVYATHTYIDFMNLLKTREGWKIVNKIFHREDKTPGTTQKQQQ